MAQPFSPDTLASPFPKPEQQDAEPMATPERALVLEALSSSGDFHPQDLILQLMSSSHSLSPTRAASRANEKQLAAGFEIGMAPRQLDLVSPVGASPLPPLSAVSPPGVGDAVGGLSPPSLALKEDDGGNDSPLLPRLTFSSSPQIPPDGGDNTRALRKPHKATTLRGGGPAAAPHRRRLELRRSSMGAAAAERGGLASITVPPFATPPPAPPRLSSKASTGGAAGVFGAGPPPAVFRSRDELQGISMFLATPSSVGSGISGNSSASLRSGSASPWLPPDAHINAQHCPSLPMHFPPYPLHRVSDVVMIASPEQLASSLGEAGIHADEALASIAFPALRDGTPTSIPPAAADLGLSCSDLGGISAFLPASMSSPCPSLLDMANAGEGAFHTAPSAMSTSAASKAMGTPITLLLQEIISDLEPPPSVNPGPSPSVASPPQRTAEPFPSTTPGADSHQGYLTPTLHSTPLSPGPQGQVDSETDDIKPVGSSASPPPCKSAQISHLPSTPPAHLPGTPASSSEAMPQPQVEQQPNQQEALLLLSPASATRHIIDEMLQLMPTPAASSPTTAAIVAAPSLGALHFAPLNRPSASLPPSSISGFIDDGSVPPLVAPSASVTPGLAPACTATMILSGPASGGITTAVGRASMEWSDWQDVVPEASEATAAIIPEEAATGGSEPSSCTAGAISMEQQQQQQQVVIVIPASGDRISLSSPGALIEAGVAAAEAGDETMPAIARVLDFDVGPAASHSAPMVAGPGVSGLDPLSPIWPCPAASCNLRPLYSMMTPR